MLNINIFLLKLMLDTWNESIFCNIKNRLQDSAMKLDLRNVPRWVLLEDSE